MARKRPPRSKHFQDPNVPQRAGALPDEDLGLDRGEPGSAGGPANMSGAPAGGSDIGGLGGTNIGSGGIDDVDDALEDRGGLGTPAHETDELDDDAGPPYSGHAGGAVGGTPAEDRATGGRTGSGLNPAES